MHVMKNWKNAWLTLMVFATLTGYLPAQETLSLSDAIAIGLEKNYNIRLAKIDRDIAVTNDDWALAGRYPTVNVTLASDNRYTNTNNPASIQISSSIANNALTPGIEANWVLFDGYRVRYTKRQLEELVQLREGELQLDIENNSKIH